jgi:nitrogen fixation protein NifZ
MTALRHSSRRCDNDVVELVGPAVFAEGDKVRALRDVRNDGTFPGRPTGEMLIKAGSVGYVRSVGTYLQAYYIYAIDFYEQRLVVGMRAHELELVDATCNAPKSAQSPSA